MRIWKVIRWVLLPCLFVASLISAYNAPNQAWETTMLCGAFLIFMLFMTLWTWRSVLRLVAAVCMIGTIFALLVLKVAISEQAVCIILILTGGAALLSLIGEKRTFGIK